MFQHFKIAKYQMRLLFVLCCLLLFTACVPTRPVVKIGLIAPFEGTYRRTGYEALAAMRMAIADMPTEQVDIVPLALDDANDPDRAYRTAQKIRRSSDVQAIIGPMSPRTASSVWPVLASSVNAESPQWFVPFSAAPNSASKEGFILFEEATSWANPLLVAIAEAVQAQEGQRLLLVGWSPGWPPEWQHNDKEAWATLTELPVVWIDSAGGPSPVVIESTDAIFWLGHPDGAADYLKRLRQHQPDVSFWMGPEGGDPVFMDYLPADHLATESQLHWVTWSDPGYATWAENHSPATPNAYLIYQITRYAISSATGTSFTDFGPWHLQAFKINADGTSSPIQ